MPRVSRYRGCRPCEIRRSSRRRIPGSPVDEPQRRIVRTGQPRRAASRFPAVSRPRVAAGVARRRDRPEAPDALARPGIVRIQEPADARFAAADPHEHFVLDDERGRGDRVAGCVVANRDHPPFAPAACVERYEKAVERADVDHVVEDCHTSVDAGKTEVQHLPAIGRSIATTAGRFSRSAQPPTPDRT